MRFLSWVCSVCVTVVVCARPRELDKEENTNRTSSSSTRESSARVFELTTRDTPPVTSPDEIWAPGNASVDTECDTAFVDEHLRGANKDWRRKQPETLREDDLHFRCEFTPLGDRKDIWPDCPMFCDSPCATSSPGKEWKQFTEAKGCWLYKQSLTCCDNLTYIPEVPDNVICLNFSKNALTRLDVSTFANVTGKLQVLVLNSNNISGIEEDALAKLTSLTHFELAYNAYKPGLNPWNFTTALNRVANLIFLALNLTTFSRNGNTKESGLTQVLLGLNLTNLTYLYVDTGHEMKLNLSHLAHLPELRVFSMMSHKLGRLTCCTCESSANVTGSDLDENSDRASGFADDVSQYCDNPCKDNVDDGSTDAIAPKVRRMCKGSVLKNLMILDLADNSLVYIPCFCCYDDDGNLSSLVPSLERLSLSVNAILTPTAYQMNCLWELKSLALTGNPLKVIKQRVFQILPKLCMLDLRFTNVMYVEREAFNHSALRYLTIQSSNWFFDLNHTANMHEDLFLGSNLTYVILSYNNFREVDQARLERILAPLQTVEYLYMSEIGLSDIPLIIQKNFTKLKVLGFIANILTWLTSDTFTYMVNLRKVELQDNHLSIVNVKAIRPLLKNKVTIDMQANPFSCSCDLRLFLDEFQMYRGEPRGRCDWREDSREACFEGTEYLCQSPESLKTWHLDDVIITEQQCLLTFQQAIFIHALSGIFIIAFLFMIVLYRYRWQWRYWVYMMNVRWSRHYGGPFNRRARFNTFVSYCKADSNFILTSVLPQVERGRRLPLCIHERDFEPGKYFTQNVVERMEESRQVLIVLSNAFLRNDWCRFELFVAHRYGLIHRRLPVTVVQLETLHMQHMDAHVITLLQATPCLEWPGPGSSSYLRDMFWRKLAEALNRNAR